MRTWVVSGLALAMALVGGCGPLIPTPVTPPGGSPLTPKQPLMAEFDRNLATWQASGITRYAFTYAPVCFCPLEAHLIVGDGQAVRIDGVPVDGNVEPPIGAPVGVEGLFQIVRRAIGSDHLNVTYDEATGVPTAMQSDPIANAIDDELDFTVTGWTLDPPDDHVLGQISLARRLWERHPIDRYVWSLAFACDCAYDGRRFDVTVANGRQTVRSGGKRVSPEKLEGVSLTVPDLFSSAAGMATSGRMTVAFDPERGYPTRLDWRSDRPDTIQRMTIRIVRFRR
jgi:hypothetical protein